MACKSKKIKNAIQFEITTTQDYCGGAAPPDELIEDLRTPKPYTGSLYIHQNATREDDGIVVEVANGTCSSEGLVEGTYYVYLDPKMPEISRANLSPINIQKADCNLQHNRKPLATIALDNSTALVTQNLHIICDPCMEPRP